MHPLHEVSFTIGKGNRMLRWNTERQLSLVTSKVYITLTAWTETLCHITLTTKRPRTQKMKWQSITCVYPKINLTVLMENSPQSTTWKSQPSVASMYIFLNLLVQARFLLYCHMETFIVLSNDRLLILQLDGIYCVWCLHTCTIHHALIHIKHWMSRHPYDGRVN